MCTIDRLHIKIKQKANKIDSNYSRDLPPAFIDDYIHDAMFDYIEMFFTGKNIKGYNLGFETTVQRIDMLSFLIETQELTPIATTSNTTTFQLPEDYYHHVRISNQGECSNSVFDIAQHHQLNHLLDNEYKRPSLKWNRFLCVFKDNTIVVYRDDNQPLTSVTLDYIKKPTKPFIGNYDTLEFSNGDTTYPNVTSAQINPGFPEEYCDILADITVQNIMGNIGNMNGVGYQQQKIINKTF